MHRKSKNKMKKMFKIFEIAQPIKPKCVNIKELVFSGYSKGIKGIITHSVEKYTHCCSNNGSIV